LLAWATAADQKLKTAKENLQNLKNLRGDLIKSKEDVKLIKADTDNIIKRLAKMMTIWNTVRPLFRSCCSTP
jgi:TnpA family transposase